MEKIIFGFLFFVVSLSVAQNNDNYCERIKHSRLHYISSENENSYVEIDNNKHTEYFDDKGNYLKSNLVWINDCEYVATITEINVSGNPFKIGDKLHVKIIKIENNIVDMIFAFEDITLKVQYEILEIL